MTLEQITQNIDEHFKALAKIGNLGPKLEEGFTRAPWSEEENKAFQYIQFTAEGHGFKTRYDAVGNLFVTLRANDSADNQIVWMGSHLDTVNNGGNYDGAAGIVAALEAMILLKDKPLSKDVELVVWRGEESAIDGEVYKGSKAAFGVPWGKNTLDKVFAGKTLRERISSTGIVDSSGTRFCSVDQIEKQLPTLSAEYISRIVAYLESHIEQGSRLEHETENSGNTVIGVVTGIRAPQRYEVEFSGSDLELARLIVNLDRIGQHHLSQGKDLVQTFGVINSGIGKAALTKVCGFGSFDLGSGTKADIGNIIETTAAEYNVRTRLDDGRVEVTGDFDHSGATPMGAKYRQDANLAIAYMLTRIADLNTGFHPKINQPKQRFSLDVRSLDGSFKNSYTREVDAELFHFLSTACSHFKWDKKAPSKPIDCAQDLIGQLERSCITLGYTHLLMPSGAGHDGAIVNVYGNIPVGMVFYACRNGKSHCESELAKHRDIAMAAIVKADAVYNLAR